MLDNLKNHPVVKRVVTQGEERVGHLVAKLLSNEKFISTIQIVTGTAQAASERMSRTVARALGLPNAEEVEALRNKLEEMENALNDLSARVDRGEDGSEDT